MHCPVFGICGGCAEFAEYSFAKKVSQVLEGFSPLVVENLAKKFPNLQHIPAFESKVSNQGMAHFRARADFRFYTSKETSDQSLFFATNSLGQNNRIAIQSCPIVLEPIEYCMDALLSYLNALEPSHILRHKLYGVSFLASQSECIFSLIYHKSLDSTWESSARELMAHINRIHKNFTSFVLGQSKGQKVILERDYLLDNFSLYLDASTRSVLESNFELKKMSSFKKYTLFSQPNPYANANMSVFLLQEIPKILPNHKTCDLLELYCGSGNFTLILAQVFRQIFASEVVKDSIAILRHTLEFQHITNITIARLNAKETQSALKCKREFERLKGVDLDSFDFGAVLVDPPRSGINDKEILEFLAQFGCIIYISCNPLTLDSDLQSFLHTHKIASFGFFEQFPYTHHIECIAILTRI
ncbi:tRNA (uridine(54)-C5)-methyltransferase TrmA [Helicobacter himalayensis]|uniref:tRNA (uridine(54)-C5)-methyltransferase TrmA n=1 Tax=Helicobacter himalayensis TaxID=1591088 RepID=UPI003D6E15EA